MKTIKKITMFITMMLVCVMVFAADGDAAIQETGIKAVWNFLQLNWGWIASVLFIISEALASTKLKSNSIFQFFMNWLKKKSTLPK